MFSMRSEFIANTPSAPPAKTQAHSLANRPSPSLPRTPSAPWAALEAVRHQCATAAIWRAHLGELFTPFQREFLRPRPFPAATIPCPRECGCAHEVVAHPGGSFAGICRCGSWNCPDLALTAGDVRLWELAWSALADALRRALGLEPRREPLRPARSCIQIGAWSGEAIPVFLLIEPEPARARAIASELLLRVRGKFLLLAPGPASLGPETRGMLIANGAETAALDACVVMDPQGRLHPAMAPARLFERLAPAPAPSRSESLARQVFQIIGKFESHLAGKPPGLLQVFTFYCIQGLSLREITARHGFPRSTLSDRKARLEKILGAPLDSYRRLAGNYDALNLRIGRPYGARYAADEEEEDVNELEPADVADEADEAEDMDG